MTTRPAAAALPQVCPARRPTPPAWRAARLDRQTTRPATVASLAGGPGRPLLTARRRKDGRQTQGTAALIRSVGPSGGPGGGVGPSVPFPSPWGRVRWRRSTTLPTPNPLSPLAYRQLKHQREPQSHSPVQASQNQAAEVKALL